MFGTCFIDHYMEVFIARWRYFARVFQADMFLNEDLCVIAPLRNNQIQAFFGRLP